MKVLNIGLFFGSFNPIHHGHLIIAQAMLALADLDEVWFIVSPQNPFKQRKSLAHEFDRYDMVKLAISGNDQMRVSDVEFHMPRPSFTVDTLTYLREKHPDHNFSLIIGGDNLRSFKKWKNADIILKEFSLLVYPRPKQAEITPLLNHESVKLVEAPMLDISATYIRKCVRQQKNIRYLVPDSVMDFISDKKLYQD